jgi:hypothetical protein
MNERKNHQTDVLIMATLTTMVGMISIGAVFVPWPFIWMNISIGMFGSMGTALIGWLAYRTAVDG